MSKKSKMILILLGLFIVFGIMGYNYVMHGGARDLATEKTAFTTSATSLLNEFTVNGAIANAKYLEKAIAVSGTITAVTPTEVTLDNSIVCGLKTTDATIQNNQKVTVKGRVVGFDDLMSEVKLDQCFITKN